MASQTIRSGFGVLAFVLALSASASSDRAAEAQMSDTTQPEVEQRVESLLAQLTLDEKLSLLGGVDAFYTAAIPTIKLPRLKMSDGPSGTRNDGAATAMAGGIALASTWNEALARDVGVQIGRDARARSVHFLLGPGVNLHVAPMNGRNFEYFGEDPYLASRMTVGYITGVQSQGVSATVKHLMANNSDFARHQVDAVIDPRAMHELYLPAFEAAAKEAKVGSIMSSYNLVNGAHMSEQGLVLNDIVKKQWGFNGLVMSDWGATYDGVAAANGGQDIEMPFAQFMNPAALREAIDKGRVTVATIDDKVRRLLRTAVRFGWLDREQTDPSVPAYNQKGRRAALQAAREGIVLLKNDGSVLPLVKGKVRTVAVIGPVAHPTPVTGGGSGEVAPFSSVSILKGLSDVLAGDAAVTYNRGIPPLAQLAARTQFFSEPTGLRPGLTVETFDNATLSGTATSTLVDFDVNRKVALALTDFAEMNFAALGALFMAPPKPSSSRWAGYYRVQEPGIHEVFLHAGGERNGTRLTIDDKVVFDNWTVRKAVLSQVAMPLDAGMHKVVLEQFNTGQFDVFGGALRLGIVRQDQLVDPAAKELVSRADVAVVAVGWDSTIETESGDRTFGLPVGQDHLVREIAAANPRTVVVVVSGGAADVSPWIDRVPGLLAAWFPGQEGGTALAEILTGAVNPSGRLPISWDRQWDENPSKDSYYPDTGTMRVVYRNGLFVGYRGYDRKGTAPLFPFGHGLSYTTFRYSDLTITPVGSDPARPQFDVAFTLSNTGTVPGATVAQVYVGQAQPKVERPVRELKGIAKVELKPGESRPVTVSLDSRAFSYFDPAADAWRADPGEYTISVGQSSRQLDLTGKVALKR
jgi:beta-glucosidase